jgi:acetyl-CoA synthetase
MPASDQPPRDTDTARDQSARGAGEIPPPKRTRAFVSSPEERARLEEKAAADPDAFWAGRADDLLEFFDPADRVLKYDFSQPSVKWFSGASLNAAYNCLDRHVTSGLGNKAALVWQGEPEHEWRVYTYRMLQVQVSRFAGVLVSLGVKKGDIVALYMPMIPELAVAMLACARIGAVHAVIHAGYSAPNLAGRLDDCGARVLVTAEAGYRAGRAVGLKKTVDQALEQGGRVEQCVVVDRAGGQADMHPGRDRWWHDLMDTDEARAGATFEPMEATEPLFILYTSGSTGPPKGVVQPCGGYLLHAAHTTQWVFDLTEEDILFCTADLGWITGHTYLIYGPLALGGTSLMFEGAPNWPRPDRYWSIVESFQATVFYTDPATIRSLMREGAEWTRSRDLSSLRLLGSVGEPISPETWTWYRDNVGRGEIPVVDTWWQTETGGICISPLPYADTLAPGSAGTPLPGVQAKVLAADGSEAPDGQQGHLVLTRPVPGLFTGVWGDPHRYQSAYFTRFPGCFETGDGARRDEQGRFWITGRLDDVINTGGHRLGTAEIEAALIAHPAVSEAAAVGMPHEVKGQSVYAYVVPRSDTEEPEGLEDEIKDLVRERIGEFAVPETVQVTDELPKTRSGKIVRRVLRGLAGGGGEEDVGDLSSLTDPSLVGELVRGKPG